MKALAALVIGCAAVMAHSAPQYEEEFIIGQETLEYAHYHRKRKSGGAEGRLFGISEHITNQKALKALLEARMRDETVEPLIFTAVGLPERDVRRVVGGTPLKMRSGVAETLTSFVRDTIVDKVSELNAANEKVMKEEVEEEEEDMEFELAILSDVPSLMHHQMALEPVTPLGSQIKTIQQRLIQRLGQFSTVEARRELTPKKWHNHQFHEDCECCKLLMLEGMALRELEETLNAPQPLTDMGSESTMPQTETTHPDGSTGSSSAETSETGVAPSRNLNASDLETPTPQRKPVVLVALNQAVGCLLDHKDHAKAVEVVQLLHNTDLPGTKVVVPVKNRASLHSTLKMAERCCTMNSTMNSTIQAPARRLQAEIMADDVMGAHMGDLDFAAANSHLWEDAAQRDLQQGGEERKPLPRGPKLTGTDVMPFWGLEKRQITLWIALGLVFAAVLTVYATVYMPLNKDPLLYTKIYTGGAVAHQA